LIKGTLYNHKEPDMARTIWQECEIQKKYR